MYVRVSELQHRQHTLSGQRGAIAIGFARLLCGRLSCRSTVQVCGTSTHGMILGNGAGSMYIGPSPPAWRQRTCPSHSQQNCSQFYRGPGSTLQGQRAAYVEQSRSPLFLHQPGGQRGQLLPPPPPPLPLSQGGAASAAAFGAAGAPACSSVAASAPPAAPATAPPAACRAAPADRPWVPPQLLHRRRLSLSCQPGRQPQHHPAPPLLLPQLQHLQQQH